MWRKNVLLCSIEYYYTIAWSNLQPELDACRLNVYGVGESGIEQAGVTMEAAEEERGTGGHWIHCSCCTHIFFKRE